MTKDQIEQIRKLAESHDFKGVPIPMLCDLAILGAITRDKWYAEYFQPSAELNYRACSAFEEAKHKWLTEANREERDALARLGRRFEGRLP